MYKILKLCKIKAKSIFSYHNLFLHFIQSAKYSRDIVGEELALVHNNHYNKALLHKQQTTQRQNNKMDQKTNLSIGVYWGQVKNKAHPKLL